MREGIVSHSLRPMKEPRAEMIRQRKVGHVILRTCETSALNNLLEKDCFKPDKTIAQVIKACCVLSVHYLAKTNKFIHSFPTI